MHRHRHQHQHHVIITIIVILLIILLIIMLWGLGNDNWDYALKKDDNTAHNGVTIMVVLVTMLIAHDGGITWQIKFHSVRAK